MKAAFFTLPSALVSLIVLGGCYTQFSTLEPQNLASQQVSTYIDSTGKEVQVVKSVDTLVTRDQETCIWERDLMGFPYLHCYPGYYPREWYLYNYSPWWYRDDRNSYDANRCPPNYYFDRNCRCCRYYLNGPDRRSQSMGYNQRRSDTSKNVNVSVAGRGMSSRTSLSSSSRSSTGSYSQPVPAQSTTQLPQRVAPAPADSIARQRAADSVSAIAAQQQRQQQNNVAPASHDTQVQQTPQNSPKESTPQEPPSQRPLRRSMRSR
jgi:hypothetical protein